MRRSERAKRSNTTVGSTRMKSLAGSTGCRRKLIPGTYMLASREMGRTALLLVGLAAAGFASTLYVFYPGIMTFDSLYIYKDMAKRAFGDWQSSHTGPVDGNRSDCAGSRQHLPSHGGPLLARFHDCGNGSCSALSAARVARAGTWSIAARLRAGGCDLARYFVRHLVATRGGLGFLGLRARLENTSSCSRLRFRAVRIRRPSAPERPRRRASSHSLSCMAFAFSLEARGAPLCARPTRAVCVGADHLLWRLPSRTAAPSAFDHCLRPWWHFVLCRREHVPGHLD